MSSENNINEIMTVEQMVQAYTETFEGKMEESIFSENIQAIKDMSAQAGITASMSIILAFLGAKVDIFTEKKHFKGTGIGGFFGIPESTVGVIMTADESKLYSDTHMFNVATAEAVAGGAVVAFHGKLGNLLGVYMSIGFGAGAGLGGGFGKWVDA